MHRKKTNDNWRFWLIGLALAMVVIVLVLLCARCAKQASFDKDDASTPALPVTYEISAQDASGKDVTGKLLIQPSTYAPEGVDVSRSVLVDISWVGKRAPEFPMIITIKDPSFMDNDGLIVFHFEKTQWEELDTYKIDNNSVSFMVDSLSPFAFVPYSSYNIQPEATATPEPSATPTATPEPSATPTASPSPSPSPSPKPTTNLWNGVPTVTATKTPEATDSHDDTQAPPVDDDNSGGGSGSGSGGGSTTQPSTQPSTPVSAPPSTQPSDNTGGGGSGSGGSDSSTNTAPDTPVSTPAEDTGTDAR